MSNIYSLTNFARWAKHHFSEDKSFPKTFDGQLRHVLELDGYTLTEYTNKEIAMFLLGRLGGLNEGWATLASMYRETDPKFIWKYGYPKNIPYDMYTAVIYYIKSNIAVSNADLFHPSLRETYKQKCKQCRKVLDVSGISRKFGKAFADKGFCTPQCYTKSMNNE